MPGAFQDRAQPRLRTAGSQQATLVLVSTNDKTARFRVLRGRAGRRTGAPLFRPEQKALSLRHRARQPQNHAN